LGAAVDVAAGVGGPLAQLRLQPVGHGGEAALLGVIDGNA
jgi:hypothetical protein